jgi:hypothetical protein
VPSTPRRDGGGCLRAAPRSSRRRSGRACERWLHSARTMRMVEDSALAERLARCLQGGPASGSFRTWPTACNILSGSRASSPSLGRTNERVSLPRRLDATVLSRRRRSFRFRS